MAGSGGVLTDLLADRRWRGLPLTDLDATEMVRSLRCAPLLAGYRGAEAADEAAVWTSSTGSPGWPRRCPRSPSSTSTR